LKSIAHRNAKFNFTQAHFIRHHKTFREHTAMVKQRTINAFPEGGESMGWQKGDLLVHFAGCWVSNSCQERWDQFWNLREKL